MRTRRAILDAVAEMFGEGEASPSADRIAERACVARRTVFHHFPTIGVLFEAVREREIDVVTSLRTDVDHAGTVSDRAAMIVTRLDLAFAVASPVFVTATPAQTADLSRRLHVAVGRQMSSAFSSELRAATDPLASRIRVEIAASFATWDQLHRIVGTGRAETRSLMTAMVAAAVLA
jgi:AcrR family transcriptional regulator